MDRIAALGWTIVLSSIACAHAQPAPHFVVRANDLGPLMARLGPPSDPKAFIEHLHALMPILVHVEPGDKVTLRATLSGSILETTDTQPTHILAKRPFDLLFRADEEVLIRLDGGEFRPIESVVRGGYELGWGTRPNEGTSIGVGVRFDPR